MSSEKNISDKKTGDADYRALARKWRSAFMGLAILICGIAIGAGITLFVGQKMIHDAMHKPFKDPRDLARHIADDLDLSKDQTEKVEEILEAKFDKINEIREEKRKEMDGELKGLEDEVASILGEEQQILWRERCERLRKFRNVLGPMGPPRGFPGGHGPDGPGGDWRGGGLPGPGQPPPEAPPEPLESPPPRGGFPNNAHNSEEPGG